jgi:hypothetical protein
LLAGNELVSRVTKITDSSLAALVLFLDTKEALNNRNDTVIVVHLGHSILCLKIEILYLKFLYFEVVLAPSEQICWDKQANADLKGWKRG